jgi:hypothetical protein
MRSEHRNIHYTTAIAKIIALRHNPSYDTVVTSDEMMKELTWWLQQLPRHNGRSMQVTQRDMVIESDASTLGWGANLNISTGGSWTREEKACHINYLELLAAFLALKTFTTNLHHETILLRLDSVTTMAFLNRRGGGTHSVPLCNLAVQIWKWCLERNIFIHAEHLPGNSM